MDFRRLPGEVLTYCCYLHKPLHPNCVALHTDAPLILGMAVPLAGLETRSLAKLDQFLQTNPSQYQ